jgi:hypothetical protein
MNSNSQKTNSKFFSTIVCPITKTDLKFNSGTQELVSEAASLAFPLKNGIPILLIYEARKID